MNDWTESMRVTGTTIDRLAAVQRHYAERGYRVVDVQTYDSGVLTPIRVGISRKPYHVCYRTVVTYGTADNDWAVRETT